MDSNNEKVENKLKVYHENIASLKTFFRKNLKEVNANQDPDAMFAEIVEFIESN